ncbi:lactonase family protein [Microbacterium sp.]|uniref:lactonase family protein n=1 Tax=Microbacterium sp. TaxID=51671 RepID=UPI003A915EEE
MPSSCDTTWSDVRFFTGGYTAEMDGAATGIGILHAGAADDVLAGGPLGFVGDAAATAGSPSWIAAHPTLDVLYAALEGDGTVQAFVQTGEVTFAPLGAPVAAGSLVCHVAVAPDGGSLIAACWGDGRVVRMTLDAAGRPSSPALAPAAVDPYAEPDPFAGDDASGGLDLSGAVDLGSLAPRSLSEAARSATESKRAHADSESRFDSLRSLNDRDDAVNNPDGETERVSRAHQTAFLPGGLIATTDMGFDLVRFWRRGPGPAGLRAVGQVVLPRGSGPRHLRWHPSGHLYVVTELSLEVFALAADASGAWRIVAGTPLGPGLLDGDAAAELAASRDGQFLYAGVRGSNTLAALRVRGDGSQLQAVAIVEAGVEWPRHHVVERDTLLVAGQLSNEVASLTLDDRTGVPGAVRHRTAVPSPTCLLRARA